MGALSIIFFVIAALAMVCYHLENIQRELKKMNQKQEDQEQKQEKDKEDE